MFQYIQILFFGLLIWKSISCHEICKPKVAVIGGGIGGASASHFLSDLFKDNLKIDLFEHDKLGGRLANIEIGGNEFEAGGAVIHPKNKYMQDFVKLLDLKKNEPGESSTAGIWNGDKFVFTQSNWKAVSIARMIWQYGFQPFALNRYVSWVLDQFDKIYKIQDSRRGFENVSSLLAAMNSDFPGFLIESIKDHLENKSFSTKLIEELVQATLVVNYGQETNVHSFVGCVSLAGSASDLWSVKGGNKLVPEKLISQNNRISVIPSRVEKIRLILKDQQSLQYEVFYTEKDNQALVSDVYNIVIIAAPLTVDQKHSIVFEGFSEETPLKFPGKYQTTVTTYVEGNLNTLNFGLESEIDAIYSCNPNKTKISSIGKEDSVSSSNSLKTWKVFTRDVMTSAYVNKIFTKVGQKKEKEWKAYPLYSTENRFDKFKLNKGLYHVNAIEWAASAMEMSAIGGRNVAILAHNDFTESCSMPKIKKNEKKKNHSSEF